MECEGTKKVQTAASCPLSAQVFRSTTAHVHKVEVHKLEKFVELECNEIKICMIGQHNTKGTDSASYFVTNPMKIWHFDHITEVCSDLI